MAALAGACYLGVLAYLACLDWRTGYLYDRLTLPLLGAGLLLHVLGVLPGGRAAFFGALLGGGLLFAVRLLSRGGLGGGDVKLAAAIGAWTGAPEVLVALFFAFLAGSAWGLVLLGRGGGLRTKIPFGPCLALGGGVAFFFGGRFCTLYGALL